MRVSVGVFVPVSVGVSVGVFVNRVQKTPKGNLPCGKFFWIINYFQIAISQPLIEISSDLTLFFS